MKQRTLVSGRGGILDNERPGRERMRQLGRAERAAGNARALPLPPPRSSRDGVFPEPSGPIRATAFVGQSGQLSIRRSAASLPGPARKSSRA